MIACDDGSIILVVSLIMSSLLSKTSIGNRAISVSFCEINWSIEPTVRLRSIGKVVATVGTTTSDANLLLLAEALIATAAVVLRTSITSSDDTSSTEMFIVFILDIFGLG